MVSRELQSECDCEIPYTKKRVRLTKNVFSVGTCVHEKRENIENLYSLSLSLKCEVGEDV